MKKIISIALLLVLILGIAIAQTSSEMESLLMQIIAVLQQLIAALTAQINAILAEQQLAPVEISSEINYYIPQQIPGSTGETEATTTMPKPDPTPEQVPVLNTHKCSIFRGDDFLPGQTLCDENGKGIGEPTVINEAERTHKCSTFRGDDFLPGQTVCGEDGKGIR